MEENIYESKSVNKLIFTFSLPAILSLLVEIMTSVVDTVFAGHLGAASTNALTAMGLLSPLLSIYTAFQALYAVSTSILVARHLKHKTARDSYFATGILFTFLVSIAVSAVSFLGIDSILNLLGAKKEIFFFAKNYLEIQLISNIFSAMGYTLTSCIRAFGYPKMEMAFTTLSVAVNLIGNIIFAFGLNMGFTGLAIGTLVSEIFCAGIAAIWLAKRNLLPQIQSILHSRCSAKALELFRLGFAQTVIQALGGCTGFFVNSSLMLYTTVTHVAIWNIVQKVYTLLLMPIVGITQSVQTIIAYYNGNSQNTKKQKTIRLTVFYTVFYGCIAASLIFLLGDKILNLFGASNEILWKSGNVLKIVFLTFPVVGVFYTILTLLEVTGYEIKAVILTLLRQVFLMLPLVYLLPNLFPQSENSIFWAVPISDFCVLFLAVFLQRKDSKPSRASKRSR